MNIDKKEFQRFKKEIRAAVADYMATEGCSCCQDVDGHKLAEQKLAKLLSVRGYADKSGYDFGKFKTI